MLMREKQKQKERRKERARDPNNTNPQQVMKVNPNPGCNRQITIRHTLYRIHTFAKLPSPKQKKYQLQWILIRNLSCCYLIWNSSQSHWPHYAFWRTKKNVSNGKLLQKPPEKKNPQYIVWLRGDLERWWASDRNTKRDWWKDETRKEEKEEKNKLPGC